MGFGMLVRINFNIHCEKCLHIYSWKSLYSQLCFPPHIIFPMFVNKDVNLQNGPIVLPQVLQTCIFTVDTVILVDFRVSWGLDLLQKDFRNRTDFAKCCIISLYDKCFTFSSYFLCGCVYSKKKTSKKLLLLSVYEFTTSKALNSFKTPCIYILWQTTERLSLMFQYVREFYIIVKGNFVIFQSKKYIPCFW